MLKLYGIVPMSLFATFETFLMAALSTTPIVAGHAVDVSAWGSPVAA